MYTRYVVGVDGSAPSEAALRWAMEHVRPDGAPLVLAHVDEPEAGLMGQDFARQELRAGAVLLADVMTRVVETGVDATSTLLTGPVPWALANATRPGDLLVIGTHKTGFLHGRVLGSRSVLIAAAATCSVAVIPATDVRFRRGVVAGLDDEDDPRAVACAAASEAAANDDELSLVQPSVAGGSGARTDAIAAVRRRFPDLVIRTRETRRSPAEAFLDASRDKALLVIGPGAADPEQAPIGSVLHDVLLNMNAPTLIAR